MKNVLCGAFWTHNRIVTGSRSVLPLSFFLQYAVHTVNQTTALGTIFKVTGGPIETSAPYLQFRGSVNDISKRLRKGKNRMTSWLATSPKRSQVDWTKLTISKMSTWLIFTLQVLIIDAGYCAATSFN